jgi:hypothetical protein
LMLMTFMLPFLVIPLVGLAIDASVCRLVELRLQAAVDGASTGAGRLLGKVDDSAVQNVASEFLKSNFTTGGGSWGAYNLSAVQGTDIQYFPGITKKIFVKARVTVPLLFLRMLGFPNVLVAAAGQANRTDSRVMVIIDRSTSMNTADGAGSTVIADAKLYASEFTGKFTESADELGLVVFDGSGVVAYPHLNPHWDPTITSTSTGGPDASFYDPSDANNMVNQINAIVADPSNGQTNTSEALWLAYMELQKAHLKDLAADGFDYRLNSIVMLTDGLPQAVSVWPNNPADNSIKAATGCVNKVVPTTYNPDGSVKVMGNPNPTPIYGWIGVSRPFTSSDPTGLYQLASRDPTIAPVSHTSTWYMTTGYGGIVGLVDPPGPPVGDWADAGCTGFHNANSSPSKFNAVATTDFSRMPGVDAYGNKMGCVGSDALGAGGVCAYKTASNFIDANGNPVSNPLSTGTTYLPSNYTSGDNWSLAFWNATDSSAQRIRADVNLAKRAGDIQNMKIAIYVIGYSGNAPGNDQGLLKRVANDTTSSSYDTTQATGLYVQAGNKTALNAAFNTVYNAILRLTQ